MQFSYFCKFKKKHKNSQQTAIQSETLQKKIIIIVSLYSTELHSKPNISKY